MSQHDLNIANQTFAATRSDLNSALEAIATLQSGPTAPATTYGGMPWIDTTDQMLKFRNVNNDGWIDVMKLDLVNDVVKQVGQSIGPDGSVSQPTYTFDSDTDTGMYRKSSNQLGFGAGGNEQMVVKSTGVDLLGTATAPTQSVSDDSTKIATTAFVQDMKVEFGKALFPVGSIYTNATNATNPSTLLGFGTWTRFGEGRVLVSQDSSDPDFNGTEETGGSKTHALTEAEMPKHYHSLRGPNGPFTSGQPAGSTVNGGVYGGGTPDDGTSAYGTMSAGGDATSGSASTGTGNGDAHNNLQPYITVYMWKRTA